MFMPISRGKVAAAVAPSLAALVPPDVVAPPPPAAMAVAPVETRNRAAATRITFDIRLSCGATTLPPFPSNAPIGLLPLHGGGQFSAFQSEAIQESPR